MIVDCQHCEALVDAKVLSEREFPPTDDLEPMKYIFLECPVCHSIMLGWTEMEPRYDGQWEWGNIVRLYPEPPSYIDPSIPKMVRLPLREAKKCLRVNAFAATAVMSGKAIEAICKEKVGAKTLAIGLKKLKERKIIDEKLFEWGEALRKERNLGAHASNIEITKEDATDIFDFARTFCEYVYVLTEKYNDYQERKNKRA